LLILFWPTVASFFSFLPLESPLLELNLVEVVPFQSAFFLGSYKPPGGCDGETAVACRIHCSTSLAISTRSERGIPPRLL
jgi:hypothetical protein